MTKPSTTLAFFILLLVLLATLAACSSGSSGKVVIRCDDCQQVELHENFQAGAVVGVVKPGDEGVTKDKRWGKLLGCMMYDVAVGDQRGWVCEKYLSFK
jgi:hypothetical protein